MMTKKIQMTATNRFLHVKVGSGFPPDKVEEGTLRDQAIRFYWDIDGLLRKNQELPRDQDLTRSLRLSFEDDFEEDFDEIYISYLDEEDYFDDGAFLPRESSLIEEDNFPEEEEEEMDLKDELYYK